MSEKGLIYTKHYRLETLPFENVPDPAFFFNQGDYSRVFEHLMDCCMAGRGLMIVAGPIGSGKTTLSQELMFAIPDSSKLIWMAEPPENSNDFFLLLAQELGGDMPPSQSRSFTLRTIRDRLLELHKAGRQCLVIVDEVHKIADDVLEAIRLLNNLEYGAAKLIQLILLGQEEFLTRLAQPELSSFHQRIGALEVIGKMDPAGVRAYILHRLRVAGGRPEIFTEAALDAIANITDGLPRVTNSLCDRALQAGVSNGKQCLAVGEVKEAVRELGDAAVDRKLFFYLLDKQHAKPTGETPAPHPDPRLTANMEPQATCPISAGREGPEVTPDSDVNTPLAGSSAPVNSPGPFWISKRKLSLGPILATTLILASTGIYFILKPSPKPTRVAEFASPSPTREEIARTQSLTQLTPPPNSPPADGPPLPISPQTAAEIATTSERLDKSSDPQSPPPAEPPDATRALARIRLPDAQPPPPAESPGTSDTFLPVTPAVTTAPATPPQASAEPSPGTAVTQGHLSDQQAVVAIEPPAASETPSPATSPAVAPSKQAVTAPKRTAKPKKKLAIKRQPESQPGPIPKPNEDNVNWFKRLLQGDGSNNSGWNDKH